MNDYLVLVIEDETAHAAQSPSVMAELIEKRAHVVEGLRRTGRHRDSGRLRPSKEGMRVRRAGNQVQVESGPFAEGGKAVGAFYWVKAQSLDDATTIANGCLALASDEIDVRPVMKGEVDADKEAKPGKIFGFLVLGNTATEEAWVQVMDRIDEETFGHFPPDVLLGGARLAPPTSGRRVATRGERHAMFDGPFLESKEVIGGVFFLRLTSLDEAVRWASESRFVVHGALEIREVWRS